MKKERKFNTFKENEEGGHTVSIDRVLGARGWGLDTLWLIYGEFGGLAFTLSAKSMKIFLFAVCC